MEFIKKQLEASERIISLMVQDHKDRLEKVSVWADMNESLLAKLDERDAEIARLKNLLRAYETVEVL